MRIEGKSFFLAVYDEGLVIEKSHDKLLETMAGKLEERLKQTGEVPDDFSMWYMNLELDDEGNLHFNGDPIRTEKLLAYAYSED